MAENEQGTAGNLKMPKTYDSQTDMVSTETPMTSYHQPNANMAGNFGAHPGPANYDPRSGAMMVSVPYCQSRQPLQPTQQQSADFYSNQGWPQFNSDRMNFQQQPRCPPQTTQHFQGQSNFQLQHSSPMMTNLDNFPPGLHPQQAGLSLSDTILQCVLEHDGLQQAIKDIASQVLTDLPKETIQELAKEILTELPKAQSDVGSFSCGQQNYTGQLNEQPTRKIFVTVLPNQGEPYDWLVSESEYNELYATRKEMTLVKLILKILHPTKELRKMLLTGEGRKNKESIKLPQRSVDIITASLAKYLWPFAPKYAQKPIKYADVYRTYTQSVRHIISKSLNWFSYSYDDEGIRTKDEATLKPQKSAKKRQPKPNWIHQAQLPSSPSSSSSEESDIEEQDNQRRTDIPPIPLLPSKSARPHAADGKPKAVETDVTVPNEYRKPKRDSGPSPNDSVPSQSGVRDDLNDNLDEDAEQAETSEEIAYSLEVLKKLAQERKATQGNKRQKAAKEAGNTDFSNIPSKVRKTKPLQRESIIRTRRAAGH